MSDYIDLGDRTKLFGDFVRNVRDGDLVRFGLIDQEGRPCFLYNFEDGYIVSNEEKDGSLRKLQSVTGHLAPRVPSPRVLLDFSGACGGQADFNRFWSLTPFDSSLHGKTDSVGAIRVPVELIQRYEILSDVVVNHAESLRSRLAGMYPHKTETRRGQGFELTGSMDG